MDLLALFKSSSLEVLFSKRIMVLVYLVLSLAILSEMVSSVWQFIAAYIYLHQFDVPTNAFIAVTICLLLPFWLVGALMLRACIQRLRLMLWVRQALAIAEYTTPFTPAEAGFLTDYEYNHRELAATLVDLHIRGVIVLQATSAEVFHIILPVSPPAGLSPYEQALIEGISGLRQRYFSSFNDSQLIEAALPAHMVLIDQLASKGMVQRERLPGRTSRIFFRVIYWVAGYVGLLTVQNLIEEPEKIFAINYPRFAVSISEPLVLALAVLVIIGVICSSYWPRLVKDYHDPRYAAWIDATGFMWYVRTVFKDRFSAQSIATQDLATLRMYVPYAIAFGVIPAKVSRIMQAIEHL
jgi:hypothetical protein